MVRQSCRETHSDLALMEMQAVALFTHDAVGRIVAINESDGDRAPRLFIGRTREGVVWRARDDLPAGIVTTLAQLLDAEPPLSEPRQRPVAFAAIEEALSAQAPITDVWEGPAWRFPDAIPEPDNVVAIGPENVDLLREHFSYTAEHLDELHPTLAVRADGDAVAVCSSVRLTPDAAEAGVYTIEGYRGRGYAASVVAAWARAVRAGGRTPLYSTSWDNLASQAVARKLGLVLYGVDLSIS